MSTAPSLSRPSLRIFDATQPLPPLAPIDDDRLPSIRWTLTQVYDRAFYQLWIKAQALDERTAEVYRDALKWWAELTGDPPLSRIDDYLVAAFVEQLLQQPGRKSETMAIGTVRKHCTQIDKLLSFCGPRTREKKGRKNLGILDLPPVLEKPYADHNPPDGDFTMEEVHAMWRACEGVRAPRIKDVSPVRWWRAFLVVACYTGLRIGQLMRLRYEDLRKPFIMVWARSSKGRRGKKQYLPAEALDEIEAIRTDRELIFEWKNWVTNKRSHHEVFKRILARAGLPEERQFAFNGFRKLHATLVADMEQVGNVDPFKVTQQSMGHTTERTAKGHYINGNVQDKIVAKAIERLPSPKPKPKPETQHRLFD